MIRLAEISSDPLPHLDIVSLLLTTFDHVACCFHRNEQSTTRCTYTKQETRAREREGAQVTEQCPNVASGYGDGDV